MKSSFKITFECCGTKKVTKELNLNCSPDLFADLKAFHGVEATNELKKIMATVLREELTEEFLKDVLSDLLNQ